MDFDSIIVFLLIFAFFVLPSILKQVRVRKKKTGAPKKNTKKNPSIFDRIGDQIRKFLKDLEEQAQQQKKASTDQGTVWETLAQDQDIDFKDTDFNETERPVFRETSESKERETDGFEPPAKISKSKEKTPFKKESVQPLKEGYRLKSDPLQNAIIWSEILSKPLALREK